MATSVYDNKYALIIDIYFNEYISLISNFKGLRFNILDTLSDILDKCLLFSLIKSLSQFVCLNPPSQAMLGSFLLICCIYFPIKIVLIKN